MALKPTIHRYARPLSSVVERVTSTSRVLRIPIRDMTRSVVRSSQWAFNFFLLIRIFAAMLAAVHLRGETESYREGIYLTLLASSCLFRFECPQRLHLAAHSTSLSIQLPINQTSRCVNFKENHC